MIRLALALARTVCIGRWARGEQAVCDVARWLGYPAWQQLADGRWWPLPPPTRCYATFRDGPVQKQCARRAGHEGIHLPYFLELDRAAGDPLWAILAVLTPAILWVVLAVLALLVGSCFAVNSDAAELAASTRLYTWKLFVLEDDGTAFRRGGDLWGGRVISSMPLRGGLHLGLRGDASALTADFDVDSPGTWRSVEGYAAASRPFRVLGVCSIGPAVVVGVLAPITTEASWSSRPMAGAGVRMACGSSWLYTLAGPNKAADARAEAPPEAAPGKGPGVRVMVAAQLELGRLSLVGDWVSGAGGYLRGGLAFRVPVPWGER